MDNPLRNGQRTNWSAVIPPPTLSSPDEFRCSRRLPLPARPPPPASSIAEKTQVRRPARAVRQGSEMLGSFDVPYHDRSMQIARCQHSSVWGNGDTDHSTTLSLESLYRSARFHRIPAKDLFTATVKNSPVWGQTEAPDWIRFATDFKNSAARSDIPHCDGQVRPLVSYYLFKDWAAARGKQLAVRVSSQAVNISFFWRPDAGARPPKPPPVLSNITVVFDQHSLQFSLRKHYELAWERSVDIERTRQLHPTIRPSPDAVNRITSGTQNGLATTELRLVARSQTRTP